MNITCRRCGIEFEKPRKRGHPPSYCSEECRKPPIATTVKDKLTSQEIVDRLEADLRSRGTHIQQNRNQYD